MEKTVEKSPQETKKVEKLSRRDFGKIAMGLGAMSIAGMSGALAAEERTQANREQYDIKVIDGVIQWKIDRKRFKRFHLTNYAFNTYARKYGRPFYVDWTESKNKIMKESKYHVDIPAPSVGDARAAQSLSSAGSSIDELSPMLENSGWNSDRPMFVPSRLLTPPDEKDPKRLTVQTKLASRLFGSDLVGITPINKDWIFSGVQTNRFQTGTPKNKDIVFGDVESMTETETQIIIPESVNNAIVVAVAMNREMIQTSPSHMSGGANNLGYSRMRVHDLMLAEFIRGLGYIAIPCSNTFGMSVPMAVEAGIGEAGRSGTIITPEYGPNVRLTKVLTNMPLIADKPIEFGVQEFCETCKKCARDCPSKTITEGPKSFDARSTCSMDGVYKWQNDYEKCLKYWVDSGTECANCLAVCPFTKGAIWVHDGVQFVIDKMRFMDPVMLGLDDAFGYGERRNEEDIWNMSIGTYGLDSNHHKKARTKGKFPL